MRIRYENINFRLTKNEKEMLQVLAKKKEFPNVAVYLRSELHKNYLNMFDLQFKDYYTNKEKSSSFSKRIVKLCKNAMEEIQETKQKK